MPGESRVYSRATHATAAVGKLSATCGKVCESEGMAFLDVIAGDTRAYIFRSSDLRSST